MKKLYSLMASTLLAMSVWAQFPSDATGALQIMPDNMTSGDFEIAIAPNGVTWIAMYHGWEGGMKCSVQGVTNEGKLLFEEPIMMADYDSPSWSMVNHYLWSDAEGNAIVAVQDSRDEPNSGKRFYYIYKLSQTGEQLWGEDGKALYDIAAPGYVPAVGAGLTMAPLKDGSMMFAWMASKDSYNSNYYIEMMRLSADGERLWETGEVSVQFGTENIQYPSLIATDYNQPILVYFRGQNQDIYARKVDFDGSSVWGEDVRIYYGGFGSIPVWTLTTVEPSGDGGAIVSFNNGDDIPIMTYVTGDGELGFADGLDGVRLSYSETMRALQVKCKYDPYTDSFIAAFLNCSSAQSYYQLTAQRVTKEGEILWGDDGIVVEPYELQQLGYTSLQSGEENQMVFFYQQHIGDRDTKNLFRIINTETEEFSTETGVEFAERVAEKTDLMSVAGDGYFVAVWEDSGSRTEINTQTNVGRMYAQRINFNGTFGDDSGVETLITPESRNAISTEYYTLSGARALPAEGGLYIKKTIFNDGTFASSKMIVK